MLQEVGHPGGPHPFLVGPIHKDANAAPIKLFALLAHVFYNLFDVRNALDVHPVFLWQLPFAMLPRHFIEASLDQPGKGVLAALASHIP